MKHVEKYITIHRLSDDLPVSPDAIYEGDINTDEVENFISLFLSASLSYEMTEAEMTDAVSMALINWFVLRYADIDSFDGDIALIVSDRLTEYLLAFIRVVSSPFLAEANRMALC